MSNWAGCAGPLGGLSNLKVVSSCMLKENDDTVSLLFKDNSAAHGSGEFPRKMEEVLERGRGFSPGEVAVLLGQAKGLGLALPDPSCLGVGEG